MNQSMLMALGLFVFRLPTTAYQELERKTTWRHAKQSRVGRRPARQFTGPDEDGFTLKGVLMPEIGGSSISLDTLRIMGDTGFAWPLIQGNGRVYGLYVIEDVTEGQSVLLPDGTPQRITFSVSLGRVDDDRVDILGDLAAIGIGVIR